MLLSRSFFSRRVNNVLSTFERRMCSSNYHDPQGYQIPYSTESKMIKSSPERIPCYRVIDLLGKVVPNAVVPQIETETLLNIQKKMIMVRSMDNVLYDAQRQGRISFYMTSTGEEGATVASAAALSFDDPVFTQYREQGVLMWRGFTLDQFTNQCFSNALDPGKGRQMPVHYGAPDLNFHFVSSPLSTQIPHAVGAAYAIKLESKFTNKKICSVVYFGEGAASEGDFHAALNFAGTLKVPCLFICRNNGYAISTPVKDQYAGDGIAIRALGYDVAAFRVDGNDPIAVYDVIRRAREYAVENNLPVLVECMSYRVGHHSTSDDSTRYRSVNDIEDFRNKNDPIKRLGGYLKDQGVWTDEEQANLFADSRKSVVEATKRAETASQTPLRELLRDVYDEDLPHLKQQQEDLKQHVAKYKSQYEKMLKQKMTKMDLSL
eukprot:c20892_g5_i1.p1 GENE.c20892_g5_i1~~c20892_g5_i1.p1  ORF type:complete len:442 (+),score=190.76 c20892_g5_i1:27-1328(+)